MQVKAARKRRGAEHRGEAEEAATLAIAKKKTKAKEQRPVAATRSFAGADGEEEAREHGER